MRDVDASLAPVLNETADLTGYASVFRYPDARYEPDAAEALRALEIAGNFCAEVRVRVEKGPGGVNE